MENNLSVLIIDQNLKESAGILANAALVVGLTAGRELPQETFGWTVQDGDKRDHFYLTRIGHNVRKASQGKIQRIREEFYANKSVIMIDYTEDAAPSDYDTYARSIANHQGEDILYRALYLYGPAEQISAATKNLSRL